MGVNELQRVLRSGGSVDATKHRNAEGKSEGSLFVYPNGLGEEGCVTVNMRSVKRKSVGKRENERIFMYGFI